MGDEIAKLHAELERYRRLLPRAIDVVLRRALEEMIAELEVKLAKLLRDSGDGA